MKRTARLLVVPVLALCGVAVYGIAANACLNDRDSELLEKESRALPGVMQIITGRFERNPPLYYQMRVKRVAAQLKKDPTQLALYDDAAVASDRLGKSDEAMAWLENKRAQLIKQKPFAQLSTTNGDKDLREQWYRYYANVGTARAHNWLHKGADRAKIGEMKAAANEITTAIKIKPNAHFGREKYQLMAMKWIINPPALSSEVKLLPNFLGFDIRRAALTVHNAPRIEPSAFKEEFKKRKLEDAVEGITGLIALGNAWESIDVFHALRNPLDMEGKGSLSEMAKLRCFELIGNGKKSLYPTPFTSEELRRAIVHYNSETPPRSYRQHKHEVEEIYTRLRNEAEEYQTKRTSYMMARLEQGRHPDMHPNFWNEWRDSGPPAPIPYTFWEKRGAPISIIGGALLLSLALLFVRRRRRTLVAA